MGREDEIRKQLQQKDSFDTGKLEQQLAAQKRQEKETDDMFDIEEARNVLRKSWLGQELVEQPVRNKKGEVVDYELKWVSVSANSKMNEKGFSSLWGTIQPFLTKTTQVSYLREETIIKLCKSTIRDLVNEIRDKHSVYEIEDIQTGSQIVNEALTIMIAAINKSREGRSMVSRERTIVEKISRALGSGEDDDSSVLGLNISGI